MASSTPFSLRHALVRPEHEKLNCLQCGRERWMDGYSLWFRVMGRFALDGGENLICFSSSVSVKPAVNPASPGPIHSCYFSVTFSGGVLVSRPGLNLVGFRREEYSRGGALIIKYSECHICLKLSSLALKNHAREREREKARETERERGTEVCLCSS